MLQSLCHKHGSLAILLLHKDSNNDSYFNRLKKIAFHLFSQIQGKREAGVDSVNFCPFFT